LSRQKNRQKKQSEILRVSCQISLPQREMGKGRYGIQTFAFGVLKNATIIAEPFAFHPAILFSLVDNNGRCPYFPFMMAYPYHWHCRHVCIIHPHLFRHAISGNSGIRRGAGSVESTTRRDRSNRWRHISRILLAFSPSIREWAAR